MNKTVIKELQKLMALCMEINEKTEHDVSFEIYGFVKCFEVRVAENGWSQTNPSIFITDIGGEKITLPNINKCRQKLLKYKEW